MVALFKLRDPAEALNARAKAQNWGVRADPALGFEHKDLVALNAMWFEKATKGIPKRSDFDIRTLKPWVRNISIVERVHEGGRTRYRFRLLGTGVGHVLGECTGKYLDEIVPADKLSIWESAYEAVLARDVPLRILSDFKMPQINYMRGEYFAAPLVGEDGQANMILAATYLSPKTGFISLWSDP